MVMTPGMEWADVTAVVAGGPKGVTAVGSGGMALVLADPLGHSAAVKSWQRSAVDWVRFQVESES
jgi:hypothetical protein